MGLHKLPEEKLNLISDFFKSGLNMRQFCSLKNIAVSTFHDWLSIYNKDIRQSKTTIDLDFIPTAEKNITESNSNEKTFIDITNSVIDVTKNVNEPNNNSLPSLPAVNTSDNSSRSSMVKITVDRLNLEFDVKILRQVLEAFK